MGNLSFFWSSSGSVPSSISASQFSAKLSMTSCDDNLSPVRNAVVLKVGIMDMFENLLVAHCQHFVKKDMMWALAMVG